MAEDPVLEGYKGFSFPNDFYLLTNGPLYSAGSRININVFEQMIDPIMFSMLVSGPVYKFSNARGHGGFLHWENIAW